ncbi:MAG: hypothetical protein ACI9XO_003037 [Paraglaciecola sp.]|jgi:hypothetical protein
MKAATLHQLKKEMIHLDPDQLLKLCLRLAKFKKDNKELLTYLLFEAENEDGYIQSLKSEIEDQMEAINKSNLYVRKKGLRKVIRYLDKCIRYSGNKETEIEMRIHLCKQMEEQEMPFHQISAFMTIYDSQIRKIRMALAKLHEDLQYDYLEELKMVER